MNLRKTLSIAIGGICGALTLQGITIEENYEYDALGRLSAVKVAGRPDLSQAYAYDASGNLIEKAIGSQSTRMTYDKANQLVSRIDAAGITEFDYDGAGRLIRERIGNTTIVEYQYGYLDKVVSVNRNGHEARFHYSPSGMLVAKETKGGMEKWAWDGMALAARGNERYINEPHISGGVPVVAFDTSGSEVNYMENDYLGNTLATYARDGANATYTAGNVTPFGESLDAELRSGLDQPRFTGKPYDKDLGAYVFPYRNYRTDVARWMTYDPSGFPDGPNQHYYAPIPTIEIDPTGKWTVSASTSVGAPDKKTLELNGASSINVQHIGGYTITVTRDQGDTGSFFAQFEFVIQSGSDKFRTTSTVTVPSNGNTTTKNGTGFLTAARNEGDYTFSSSVKSLQIATKAFNDATNGTYKVEK
ncbi:RHS repeat-associated core domain-containing protein [Rubellicoccus peritrichatus]|uniref:RHS repeat-associated core domain-containing protein n=1 Tax=Rubellicoccus peritrichatus TaxID=3080537 RepID=A0AAQ3LB06_9BACT|nr:RHS repeat-associated core domain-containing protein [Puniceicoccus sp. CR14]WOO42396.1 RHS repeat-associated core domain-containing protein [Puniceicoccus sp. CR14]